LKTPPYPPRKRGGKGPSRLCKRRHIYRLGDLVRAAEEILIAMAALARMQRAATLVPTKSS
jgi:hypothetical protein